MIDEEVQNEYDEEALEAQDGEAEEAANEVDGSEHAADAEQPEDETDESDEENDGYSEEEGNIEYGGRFDYDGAVKMGIEEYQKIGQEMSVVSDDLKELKLEYSQLGKQIKETQESYMELGKQVEEGKKYERFKARWKKVFSEGKQYLIQIGEDGEQTIIDEKELSPHEMQSRLV